MASEFMADASERLIKALNAFGMSPEIAGMVAAEWQSGIQRDWGGERPYIGKGGEALREMSRRDRAILREHAAGERVAYLSRKFGISRRMVWLIIQRAKECNALP